MLIWTDIWVEDLQVHLLAVLCLVWNVTESSESDDTHLVWFGAKLVIRKGESR